MQCRTNIGGCNSFIRALFVDGFCYSSKKIEKHNFGEVVFTG